MTMIHVRPYTLADYEALLDVQKEAFPPPFPEELWWSREQIAAHVEVFPAGAMLAEVDGLIVGSATSLIIKHRNEPHTWTEISDHGYIRTSHQPDGDSLYGIDICVRPSWRGRGVAQKLYEARKQLVKQIGLERFLAGCRIPGYHHVAAEISAAEYVEEVTRGKRHDPVLSFMLKQGLHPVSILDDYLEDEESRDKAVLVEWRNPDLHQAGRLRE